MTLTEYLRILTLMSSVCTLLLVVRYVRATKNWHIVVGPASWIVNIILYILAVEYNDFLQIPHGIITSWVYVLRLQMLMTISASFVYRKWRRTLWDQTG